MADPTKCPTIVIAVCLSAIAAIGLAACVPVPPGSRATAATALCDVASSWSTPVPASSRNPRFPGRAPSIAFQGARWIVATDSVERFDLVLTRSRFAVKGEDGLDWSPPGNTTTAFPHLAQSNPDAVQLLWGGMAQQRDSSSWKWPPKITTVWQAELRNDGTATRPTALYSAQMIDWNQVQPARPVWGPRGQLITMFSAIKDSLGPVMVVARRRSTGWDVRELSLPVTAAYVAVAVVGDTVVAAIIGSGTTANPNSVWAMSSPDFGTTWSTPTVVSSPIHPADFISAAVFRGQVHLFWTQFESNGNGQASLRHASYNPATKKAGLIQALTLPHGATNVRTAVTSCGIHVIAADFWPGAPEKGLFYTRWTDGWAEPQHILHDYLIDDADIASNDQGDLAVAFSGFRFNGVEDSPHDLLISRAARQR